LSKKESFRVRTCLRVSDIRLLHRTMKETGVKVDEIEGGEGCGWTFQFWDINNNPLVAWSGYTRGHDW